MEATISATNSTMVNQFEVNWNLILDFTRVLTWPFIVGGFLIYFRKNIGGLVDRITLVKGPGGTEIRVEQQQRAEGQKEGIGKISKEDVKNDLQSQIEEIKKQYEDQLSKEKKASTDKDQIINHLLEQLSFKSLQLEFEQIYRLIFGSQIDLLKRLKASPYFKEPTGNTILFFVLTQRIFPIFTNWTFNQYLNFLFTTNLIYFANDCYFITDRGKAFLAYIEILNYPKKDL